MTATGDVSGELIAGRYRLTEVIGGGGMGVVYRGRDTRIDGRLVAVKVLVPAKEIDSDAGVRFEREARIMGRLSHPNLVAILDTGQLEDSRPFIVMEHLVGETLADRIKRQPLGVDEIVEVVTQVARGLDVAHDAGVVHRDLKPHNIFLCGEPGQLGAIKVLDFGISKLVGSMTMRTETTQIVGTPQYMAPEQARGEHALTSPRSDVFALGVIAYELASGTRPFDGQMLHEVIFKILDHRPEPLVEVAKVPATLSNAVAVAMAKEPRDRFASAGEFARAVSGEAPVEAPAPPPAEPAEAPTVNARPRPSPSPTAGRSRRRLGAWIAAAAVAIAGAAGIAWSRLGDRAEIEPGVAALERAYQIGDAGRGLLAAGRGREALVELARAYRRGDRRLATRIALRRAIAPADALVLSVDGTGIDSADIARSGDAVVIADEGVARVYDLGGQVAAALRPAGGRSAVRLGFSEDGGEVVIGDTEGVRVFDRRLRRQLQSIDGAAIVHLLPDDGLIYRVKPGATQVAYERRTLGAPRPSWTVACELPHTLRAVWSIGPGLGRMAMCAGASRLIDVATGETVGQLPGGLGDLVVLDERRTLGIDPERRATLYGAGEPRPVTGLPAPLRQTEVSADGALVAFSGQAAVQVRRVAGDSLPVLRRFSSSAAITALRFGPGSTLAFGDESGLVRVVDARTGLELMRADQLERVAGLDFADDGKLVSWSRHRVRVWEPARGPLQMLAPQLASGLRLEGDALVYRSGDRLWYIDVDEPGAPEVIGPAASSWALSDSGRWLQSGDGLIELSTGARIETSAFETVALSADAELIGGRTGSGARLLRRSEGALEPVDIGAGATDVRPSPRGQRAVVTREVAGAARLEVRDVSGEVLASRDAKDEMLAAFYGADRIVSARAPGIRLWYWRSGRVVDVAGVRFPLIETGADVAFWLDGGLIRLDLARGAITGTERPCERPQATWTATPELAVLRCDNRALVWSLIDRRQVLALDAQRLGGRFVRGALTPDGRLAVLATESGLVGLELDPEDRGPEVITGAVARFTGLEL